MELMSAWGPLIYAGCFAATLSSAIASLVGAPRVLQALAKDKLYPGLFLFSKGSGANNDPVRGYILVFVISFICIMIGGFLYPEIGFPQCFNLGFLCFDFGRVFQMSCVGQCIFSSLYYTQFFHLH